MFPQAHNFTIPYGQFLNIQGDQINNYGDSQRTDRPADYFQVMTDCPTSTPNFTGREDILVTIDNFFHPPPPDNPRKTQKIFLLYGLGGAGKTQVALEFTRRFKQRFTKIYYIAADSEISIKASLFDIAMVNGVVGAQNWQSGLRWLHTHEESWMIIMDNADNPKISLNDYFPTCDHGNIIITSRNAELQNVVSQSLQLQDMIPDDGIKLLLKHAADRPLSFNEQEQAVKIAKELYHFPLALVQAGAYIKQQKCLMTYLTYLNNERKQILEKKLPQPPDKYKLSIYATWNISWKQLSGRSKTLLEICSYLHYHYVEYII
ncbi:P-loop containing nucleoside triphosphate hydrolase protein [Lentinula edodes]|uniref:P-loop containing nucleoside triphosphate hydrolase protein n=1 Tax=Lentinula lateritia TaxID=40482 RepID=A0A9W9DL73_9AGAR|nr:P-loop containing nucleoside triphosphate hydrolase protein [Lentinula edodes]